MATEVGADPSVFQWWGDVIIPAIVGGSTSLLAIAAVIVSVLSYKTSVRATRAAEQANEVAERHYSDTLSRERIARLRPLARDLQSWHHNQVRMETDKKLPPEWSPSPASMVAQALHMDEPSFHIIHGDLHDAIMRHISRGESTVRADWARHRARAFRAIEVWKNDPDLYESSLARADLLGDV